MFLSPCQRTVPSRETPASWLNLLNFYRYSQNWQPCRFISRLVSKRFLIFHTCLSSCPSCVFFIFVCVSFCLFCLMSFLYFFFLTFLLVSRFSFFVLLIARATTNVSAMSVLNTFLFGSPGFDRHQLLNWGFWIGKKKQTSKKTLILQTPPALFALGTREERIFTNQYHREEIT